MEQDISSRAQEIYDIATEVVITYGLDMIGAVLILVFGWIVAGWTSGLVSKGLGRIPNFDATLKGLIASLTKYLVLTITVIAVLDQFGVQTTSLIAVMGTVGLAIGLALQGTLSNVAAGVMLLFFRPFKIGDYVTAGGIAGTVKNLGLFVTELSTPDNVRILVPNNQIWGNAIHNFSANPTRRVDFLLGIGYESDIEKAMGAINAVIDGDERVLAEPDRLVAVSELADSSVNITVRIWCNSADYWGLKFDLTKAFKQRFDAEGITIPFPQIVVHQG